MFMGHCGLSMDIEERLRTLGRLEKLAKDSRPKPPECWPKWRILLAVLHHPRELEEWWWDHGAACPRCRRAREQVEQQARTRRPTGTDDVLEVPVAVVREEALPYAAAVPELPLSPASELPWVEFHKVEGPLPPGVEVAWLVVWEEALFVVVVGQEAAVERLGAGARLLGSSGECLGNLVRAEGRLAELLLPAGAAPGRRVLVLQCDRSAGELAARSFAIPELAGRGIRLVPKDSQRSGTERLLADLVKRNRLSRFLNSLPAEVESPAEALTLSFYLRLLIHQGRLTPGEARRLAALPWLTPDLKAALQRGRGTEEDDPPE